MLFRSVIEKGLVRSAHDLAEGGLAVALAECLLSDNLGAKISIEKDEDIRIDSLLFGETQSRILFSIPKESQALFEDLFKPFSVTQVGIVTSSKELSITINDQVYVKESMSELAGVYNDAIQEVMA